MTLRICDTNEVFLNTHLSDDVTGTTFRNTKQIDTNSLEIYTHIGSYTIMRSQSFDGKN